LGSVQIVTTDEVLVEFLTQLGGHDVSLWAKAVALTRSIRADPHITVIPQTRTTFDAGLALYEARPDKTYSLTDCISMQTMRVAEINEVLTYDEHFAQVRIPCPFSGIIDAVETLLASSLWTSAILLGQERP
jgi:predicted nucleic acid-binding protein